MTHENLVEATYNRDKPNGAPAYAQLSPETKLAIAFALEPQFERERRERDARIIGGDPWGFP